MDRRCARESLSQRDPPAAGH